MFKFYLVLFFALILGILFDYLFYGKPIGISFFVFISIFIIFSLILAKKFGQKLTKIQYLLLIPIILFSVMVFYWATSFITFFNIINTLFLISLFLILFSKEDLLNFNFSKYLISPLSFFGKSLGKSAKFIEEVINQINSKKKIVSPEFKSLVRGIIISLPILTLLIWLLSSADIVFRKYLEKMWQIFIDPEIVLRILIVLGASYFFIGVFTRTFFEKKSLDSSIAKNQSKFLDSIESSVILGLVELLFLIFIIIQFFYLFGGKTYVWGIDEYITYAEYARRGFGELIAVSIISFLLIYGIDKFGKRENIFQKRIFKILSSILILQLFVIMASAFTRLSLYIDGYGYTFLRLLSFIFLFWLFFFFLLFLFKIFSEQKETYFIFSTFWLIILFWIGMNFLNLDAFIAKKNIERYLRGKPLDTYYLSRLSEDAISEIVKIFEVAKEEKVKTEIANQLYLNYCDFIGVEKCKFISFQEALQEIKETQRWQSFNISKNKALEILEKYSREIEDYRKKWFEEYEQRLSENQFD